MNPLTLLIDNYDSFTYNLSDYFARLGHPCEVVRNDQISLEDVRLKSPGSLIFSPGPGRPESAGIMMELLAHYAGKIPILGICLGHQAIGVHFGIPLVHAPRPVYGQTSEVFHDQSELFARLDNPFPAMRYHSLILDPRALGAGDPTWSSPLKVNAWTASGEIMGVRHRHLPIAGFQFHPESILSPQGLTLIENWLGFVG